MSDRVLQRLKRAKGQLKGVIRMYENEESCVDVVTQITAVREALAGVGKELLGSEAVKCSREKESDKLERVLKQLFKLS